MNRVEQNYILYFNLFILFKNYKFACKFYMKDGRDGFQMLTKCPVLVSYIFEV